jgi:hypothetical protein
MTFGKTNKNKKPITTFGKMMFDKNCPVVKCPLVTMRIHNIAIL